MSEGGGDDGREADALRSSASPALPTIDEDAQLADDEPSVSVPPLDARSTEPDGADADGRRTRRRTATASVTATATATDGKGESKVKSKNKERAGSPPPLDAADGKVS